jgi:RNA methyltransferase, TrmH family
LADNDNYFYLYDYFCNTISQIHLMARETINSLQNAAVKNVVRLQQKAPARKEQNLFVIEGRREVFLALQAGIEPVQIFYCMEVYSVEKEYSIDFAAIENFLTPVTREVYEKIAYRGDTQGILMVARQFSTRLENIRLGKNSLIVVLESVEKPGNLGGILRTADAAGVDAVIVCDPRTDVFNPNVIRSGLGCLFTNHLAVCTNAEAQKWLIDNGIKILIASLQAESWYHETDLTAPLALVFGPESTGLSQSWYDATDISVKIPMLGKIDSLNVATSVAVLLYEAQRQRGFPFNKKG